MVDFRENPIVRIGWWLGVVLFLGNPHSGSSSNWQLWSHAIRWVMIQIHGEVAYQLKDPKSLRFYQETNIAIWKSNANVRRPRPWPRQGRRLGPPEVWNLVCHGHGLHHVQACSSKLAPRRPIQGNSSARHQRPNTMLPQAFPKPTSPPASPSKATLPLNITGQTLGPSAFKALQACRLHAQACSSQLAPRRPIQRLFRYTPAAKHQGHVLLKVFKPAVCPPSNP